MTVKKFFRIAAIAWVVMTAVSTPLIYAALIKPTGLAPSADPDLTVHLLRSGLWAAAMSVLLLSAYGVALWIDSGRQKQSA
jgi:hypothetical protein